MKNKAFNYIVGIATIIGAAVALSQCVGQGNYLAVPPQTTESTEVAPLPAPIAPSELPSQSGSVDMKVIVAVTISVDGAAQIGPHEFGCCGISIAAKAFSAGGELSWDGCYVRWTAARDGELYTTATSRCGEGIIFPGPGRFAEPPPGSYVLKADISTDWGSTAHSESAFTVEKTNAN